MKANKILIPTDFSASANNALEYGIDLAEKLGGEVIIFHSSHYPRYSSDIDLESIDKTYENSIRQEEAKLEEMIMKIRETNAAIPCRYINKNGMAADNIIAIEKEENIDLILMGTQGADGFDDFIMGSITAEVIEKASCPVFAIPANVSSKDFKKIVFASDLKESDIAALCELSNLAKAYKASITVLNITENGGKDHLQKFEAIRDKVIKCLGFDHIEYEHTESRNIARGIADYTRNHPESALVMATHKRRGINKIFRPSITKKVALNSKIPLLAIHI